MNPAPATPVAKPASLHKTAAVFCGSQSLKCSPAPSTDWRSERRRKRAVRAAQDYFRGELRGSFKGRSWALQKIAAHDRPLAEAKRLVEWFHRQGVAEAVDGEEIGHDSVQELRVKLIRRDLVLDQPQAMLLNRMDKLIALGDMTRERFEHLAATVLAMKPALSPEVRQQHAN